MTFTKRSERGLYVGATMIPMLTSDAGRIYKLVDRVPDHLRPADWVQTVAMPEEIGKWLVFPVEGQMQWHDSRQGAEDALCLYVLKLAGDS